MGEIIKRHDRDGGVTVKVAMPRGGMRAEVRVGLTKDGRVPVLGVTILPESWDTIDDEADWGSAHLAHAYLREVPMSEAWSTAFADPDFARKATERANAARTTPPAGGKRTGRGRDFKDDQLMQIAYRYLEALTSEPRRAVERTRALLLLEDRIDLSVSQLRARLRACYERGYLSKIDTPGKAGAVAGRNLPMPVVETEEEHEDA